MRTRKVLLFLGLAYALGYALVAAYLALGGRWEMPGSMVVTIVYMFTPLAAALIVQRLIYREAVIAPLRLSLRPNRWFLLAWLLPPLLAVAAIGTALLLPGVSYSPGMEGMIERFEGLLTPEQLDEMREQLAAMPVHPFWLGLVQGLVAGVTVNAAAALGEELGWRGLLLRELEPLGFWRLSALTGVAWGFWHAPIILLGHNYPDHPVAGVFMMTAFTVLFSPLFTLVTLRAGSVIAAAVLHGTINATGGFAVMLIRGGNDLLVGMTGLAGLLVLVVVNLLVLVHLRRAPLDLPRRRPSHARRAGAPGAR